MQKILKQKQNKKESKEDMKRNKGITLIALVVTILFPYDEKLKCSNKHVNTKLVMLNWNIGNKIKVELLNNKKPEYAEQVIKELSKKLVRNYGRGYSSSKMRLLK